MPFKELKKIKCNKIIWFPMFDGVSHIPFRYTYLQRINIKIICFSKKLYNLLKLSGLECYYFQYFNKPKSRYEIFSDKKIFFWVRREDITWTTLKILLGNTKVEKISMRLNPDPNNKIEIPSKEDQEKYNIEIIKGWIPKEKHIKLLSDCNIFIQPRLEEGIGLSFIEALSLGLCVISPNKPTMNEYIEDKKTGYLYNLKKPKPIDFSSLDKIRKNIYLKSKDGYKKWEKDKKQILYVIKKSNRSYDRILFLIFQILFYFSYIIDSTIKLAKRLK